MIDAGPPSRNTRKRERATIVTLARKAPVWPRQLRVAPRWIFSTPAASAVSRRASRRRFPGSPDRLARQIFSRTASEGGQCACARARRNPVTGAGAQPVGNPASCAVRRMSSRRYPRAVCGPGCPRGAMRATFGRKRAQFSGQVQAGRFDVQSTALQFAAIPQGRARPQARPRRLRGDGVEPRRRAKPAAVSAPSKQAGHSSRKRLRRIPVSWVGTAARFFALRIRVVSNLHDCRRSPPSETARGSFAFPGPTTCCLRFQAAATAPSGCQSRRRPEKSGGRAQGLVRKPAYQVLDPNRQVAMMKRFGVDRHSGGRGIER